MCKQPSASGRTVLAELSEREDAPEERPRRVVEALRLLVRVDLAFVLDLHEGELAAAAVDAEADAAVLCTPATEQRERG